MTNEEAEQRGFADAEDSTEPGDEALIDALDKAAQRYEAGLCGIEVYADARVVLRARLASKDEALATCERERNNAIAECAKQYARAEAALAELEAQQGDGWTTVAVAKDALVRLIGDGYAERSLMPAVGRVERIVASLKARAEAAEAALAECRAAVVEAERMFRWYGDLHAAKEQTPDNASKTKRNYDIADKMARALAKEAPRHE
jgi:prefoldin subunit 5